MRVVDRITMVYEVQVTVTRFVIITAPVHHR